VSSFYTNLFVVSLDRRIKISDNFESLGQAKSNSRCHNRTLVTDYSACKEVLTGSFGTPCLIRSVGMTSCTCRWTKVKRPSMLIISISPGNPGAAVW